jgi:hypothetical protein
MSNMTRKVKVLGLALVAVCAIGAVAASAASAHKFHSEVEPTVLTSNNESPITIGIKNTEFKVECGKSAMNGTLELMVKELILVHPTYSECKWGAKEATIDTSECDYYLYGETTEHLNTEGFLETDAPVTIECTPGKTITITSGLCKVKIETQKIHGATYKNETDVGGEKKEDITIKMTLDKIKYKSEGCGLLVPKEGEEGYLTGPYTMTGYEDKDTEPPKAHQCTFKEGKQVGIKIE